MGYSELQTRSYNGLMYNLEHFEKMKKDLSRIKCPTHGKKAKVDAYWEEEYQLDIVVSRYCCIDFAKEVSEHFIDAKIFDNVVIAKWQFG